MMEGNDHNAASASSLQQQTTVPSVVAQDHQTAVQAAPSTAGPSQDDATRVLKKGDLVRIAERKQSGLKARPGGLGRVIRSISIDDTKRPFKYDVEWVLGGRLLGASRDELRYTTADAEGMTTKRERKRKPSAIVAESAVVVAEKKPRPKKKKPVAKKKVPAAKKKPPAKKKKPSVKKTVAKKVTKAKAAAAGSKKRKGATEKKTGNKRRKEEEKESLTVAVEEPSSSSNALDLYDRQKREFDRLLQRLERIDPFGFFLGPPLPGYEEEYGLTDNVKKDGGTKDTTANSKAINDTESGKKEETDKAANETPTTEPNAQEASVDKKKSAKKKSQRVQFPSTPPFNFQVVRKRMEHGRYVLDRTALEEDKHKNLTRKCGDWKKSHHKDANDGSTEAKKMTTQNMVLYPKGIHWDLFRQDVLDMCNAAISRDPRGTDGGSGTLGYAATKIKDAVEQMYERTGRRHASEMALADAQHKYTLALNSSENNEAAFQGEWRQHPFPERKYERLYKSNVICAGLSDLDESSAKYELQTTLKDSFVGLSYKFEDIGQSEGWMNTVIKDTGGGKKRSRKKVDEMEEKRRAARALVADNGVVRAQVQAAMQTMLISVQDRVMTDLGVLHDPELRSANWEAPENDERKGIEDKQQMVVEMGSDATTKACKTKSLPADECELVEQPVWGLDCYTRRNITMCLETEIDTDIAFEFIEKWLLPAINACPVDIAHNITYAARILEGIPLEDGDSSESSPEENVRWSHSLLGKALLDKMKSFGPPWLKEAARELRLAYEAMGPDFFRVHPKGHGSVVLRHDGIPANTLVTFYRGEVYPPWRWSEKMDAIEMSQTKLGLRPNLPDFYNMALERPQVDPRGYGLLFVDASRKAGHGSSLSHSCEPTCEVRVSAVKGQLCLAMTTLRDIEQGEELTFDYNAVTESLNEYRAAICLCGYRKCRGSFLHFATADCYQQVLSRNSPIAVRFANLIKGCMKKVMSEDDDKVLKSHGFGTAAFGAVSFNHHMEGTDGRDSMDYVPIWLRTFVADTLRYIEYERRALPIALLCNELSTSAKDAKDTNLSKLNQESANSNKNKAKKAGKGGGSREPGRDDENNEKSVENEPSGDDKLNISPEDAKPVPGSKPMPVFLFFASKQRDYFLSVLEEEGLDDLNGAELKRALQKVAGSSWNALGDDRKQFWRDQAVAEWEKNGGKDKALLEEERKRRISEARGEPGKEQSSGDGKNPTVSLGEKAKKKIKPKNARKDDFVCPSKISFEAADAEGVAAMEQRIQQLTQALSRVGRVLDRHRESILADNDKLCRSSVSPACLRSRIHSPISILSDEHVVGWVWNHENGVVQTLLRTVEAEKCASPALKKSIRETERKFKALRVFQNPMHLSGTNSRCEITPAQARKSLTSALLEFREILLNGILDMENDMKLYLRAKARKRDHARRDRLRKKREEEIEAKRAAEAIALMAVAEYSTENTTEGVVSTVRCVLNNMVDTVVARNSAKGTEAVSEEESCFSDDLNGESEHVSSVVADVLHKIVDTVAIDAEKSRASGEASIDLSKMTDVSESPKLSPWMEHYKERGKLAAAADLLLLYAHTSTFFVLKPYIAFESTPIEVYARELGNAVPKSIMDVAEEYADSSFDQVVLVAESQAKNRPSDDAIEFNSPSRNNGAVDCANRGMKQNSSSSSSPMHTDVNVIHRTASMESPHSGTTVDPEGCDTRYDVALSGTNAPDNRNGGKASGSDEYSCGVKDIDEKAFVPGERFSVLREGKDKYCTGVVVKTNLEGDVKRVKFHFPKMLKKFDEWVEVGSSRIAPLSLIGGKQVVRGNESTGPKVKKDTQATNLAKKDDSNLCKPDDIITNVFVKYQGDYVLSQLLQWYNGGIGQKPGMPDLIGCALLPPLSGCFSPVEGKIERKDDGNKRRSGTSTLYESEVRPLLKDWFKDANKRGNPWPEEIRNAFNPSNTDAHPADASSEWAPLGSPILDLLVTGDDKGIQHIVMALMLQMNPDDMDTAPDSGSKRRYKSTAERLQSSVDVGRPAQAVANWVQCENPECLKWRKLPWHVDIDVLPEKFFCKDNIWNPVASSCDAQEDSWDEVKEQALSPKRDVKKAPINGKKAAVRKPVVIESPPGKNQIDNSEFVPGARFDVLRIGHRNKTICSTGVVVETDVKANKVKFHFARMHAKFDEWIDADSTRIAPLSAKTSVKKADGDVTCKQETCDDKTEGNSDFDLQSLARLLTPTDESSSKGLFRAAIHSQERTTLHLPSMTTATVGEFATGIADNWRGRGKTNSPSGRATARKEVSLPAATVSRDIGVQEPLACTEVSLISKVPATESANYCSHGDTGAIRNGNSEARDSSGRVFGLAQHARPNVICPVDEVSAGSSISARPNFAANKRRFYPDMSVAARLALVNLDARDKKSK